MADRTNRATPKADRHRTAIYTGVTSDLLKRVWQHKQKQVAGFTSRYNCDLLVWYEETPEVTAAIAREKQIKSGSRRKKELLIETLNPEWLDLAAEWCNV